MNLRSETLLESDLRRGAFHKFEQVAFGQLPTPAHIEDPENELPQGLSIRRKVGKEIGGQCVLPARLG
jgi:hypothetical protein